MTEDHEWQASIVNRIDGSECPVCAGRLVVGSTCLETTHPEAAALWHPTKNGDCTPKNVCGGTERSAWWKCPKGVDHIWKAQIKNVALGGRCPICNGKKAVTSNCLATTHPHLTPD